MKIPDKKYLDIVLYCLVAISKKTQKIQEVFKSLSKNDQACLEELFLTKNDNRK